MDFEEKNIKVINKIENRIDEKSNYHDFNFEDSYLPLRETDIEVIPCTIF